MKESFCLEESVQENSFSIFNGDHPCARDKLELSTFKCPADLPKNTAQVPKPAKSDHLLKGFKSRFK